MTAHAMHIDTERTVIDHRVTTTPPDAFESLSGLLGRLAPVFQGTGEGVVVLSKHAGRKLGFRPESMAFAAARLAGWRVGDTREHATRRGRGLWVTFWCPGRPTIHVADHEAHGPDAVPVMATEDPVVLVRQLAYYHHMMGGAYHTTPGATGCALLRDRYGPRDRRLDPTWVTEIPKGKGAPDVKGPIEQHYSLRQWTREVITPGMPDSGPHVHRYDANLMEMAGAQTGLFPKFTLEHTGKIGFDKKRGGYWKIKHWQWPDDRLPDPAGYRPRWEDSPWRWVTSPTLALLTELAVDGLYPEPEVADSWTSPAGPWLRKFAEAMARTTLGVPDGDLPNMVAATNKMVAHETTGMIGRPGGRVYNPAARHTLVGMSRSNLWRKMRKIGDSEGRYPLRVNVDCVYYASADPNPITAAPKVLRALLPPGRTGAEDIPGCVGLGGFKIEESA